MGYDWRKKRKSFFIVIIIIFILAFTFYKVYPILFPKATCFDGKQNGGEFGVDCGGSCALVCSTEILPLEVKFARAIESEPGLFDLVALVENKNSNKSVEGGLLNYTFNIYDKSGTITKSIPGTTNLSVGQTFPVILQNVPIDFGTSGNAISKVVFVPNLQGDWQGVNQIYSNVFFKVLDTVYIQNKNDITQLTVSLQNVTRAYFRDVPVRITLMGEDGNIVAVNESVLKEVKANEKKDVIFTWRNPLTIENPKIDVYTIVTPNTYIR